MERYILMRRMLNRLKELARHATRPLRPLVAVLSGAALSGRSSGPRIPARPTTRSEQARALSWGPSAGQGR